MELQASEENLVVPSNFLSDIDSRIQEIKSKMWSYVFAKVAITIKRQDVFKILPLFNVLCMKKGWVVSIAVVVALNNKQNLVIVKQWIVSKHFLSPGFLLGKLGNNFQRMKLLNSLKNHYLLNSGKFGIVVLAECHWRCPHVIQVLQLRKMKSFSVVANSKSLYKMVA